MFLRKNAKLGYVRIYIYLVLDFKNLNTFRGFITITSYHEEKGRKLCSKSCFKSTKTTSSSLDEEGSLLTRFTRHKISSDGNCLYQAIV